jgi:hypothetical protein
VDIGRRHSARRIEIQRTGLAAIWHAL